MTSEDYGAPIVGENILDLFPKRPTGDRHGFGGKVVHALPAGPDPGNTAPAWNHECEAGGAGPHVAVNIAASKGCVGVSDDLFQRVRHVAKSTIKPLRAR